MSSVVYQESANNYTNGLQKILGKQITTMSFGATIVPAILPDYVGQFYFYLDRELKPYLYVSTGTGLTDWVLVDTTEIPENVVREDLGNNFKRGDQRILDKQITTVHYGASGPTTTPSFIGQFYIELKGNEDPILYVAQGMATPLDWHPIATPKVDTSNFAKLDQPNNFTKPQTFNTRPIPSVIMTSVDPGIVPEYIGQLYVKSNTAPTGTADLWIAVGTSKILDWYPISSSSSKGNVNTDTPNNFKNVNQKIKEKQLVTVIIGTTKVPSMAPDFDGQLYFFHDEKLKPYFYIGSQNSSNGWILLDTEAIPPGLVDKSIANNFTNTSQTILDKQIPTIQTGETRPTTKPDFVGQFYIEIPKTYTVPNLYVATDIKDSNSWLLIDCHVDTSNFAKLDTSNAFKGTQTIDNNVITTSLVAAIGPTDKPDYKGQLYFNYNSEKTRVDAWASIGNQTIQDWLPIDLDTSTFANLNTDANFTKDLRHKDRVVPGIEWSAKPPENKPLFVGQLYAQFIKKDGSTVYKVQMWVAMELDSKDGWVPIQANAPESVNTNQANNFTSVEQTIKNKQILSAIISGEGNPPTGVFPDYEGQLYIASKAVGSGWDTQIWIGHFTGSQGSQGVWIPLGGTEGTVFPKECTFKESNYFENKKQYLGRKDDPNNERIMGARVVDAAGIHAVKSTRAGEMIFLRSPSILSTDSYTGTLYIALDDRDPDMWGALFSKEYRAPMKPVNPDSHKETLMGMSWKWDHEDPKDFPAPERVGQMMTTNVSISQTQVRYNLWIVLDIDGTYEWVQIKSWIK